MDIKSLIKESREGYHILKTPNNPPRIVEFSEYEYDNENYHLIYKVGFKELARFDSVAERDKALSKMISNANEQGIKIKLD